MKWFLMLFLWPYSMSLWASGCFRYEPWARPVEGEGALISIVKWQKRTARRGCTLSRVICEEIFVPWAVRGAILAEEMSWLWLNFSHNSKSKVWNSSICSKLEFKSPSSCEVFCQGLRLGWVEEWSWVKSWTEHWSWSDIELRDGVELSSGVD